MAIKIFKRYEKKYILNKEQYDIIKDVIKNYMSLDKYCLEKGKYTIYNIYFDNDRDDIIRSSINAEYYKEKIRVRSYELFSDSNKEIFFELKKKIGGIVSKRRIIIPFKELDCIYNNTNSIFSDNQISNEISYFINTNNVKPKVFISYDREAYFSNTDKNFRVTFDSNIKSRRNNINFKNNEYDKILLDENKYLMEIKTSNSIPIWCVKLLSELKIYSTSYSKYGNEYKQEILNRRRDKAC